MSAAFSRDGAASRGSCSREGSTIRKQLGGPPRRGLTWPPDSAVTAASSFRSVREASQHPPRTPVGGGPRAATLLHLPANETHERAARQALLGSGRQLPAEPTHSPAHPHLWGFRLPLALGPSFLACSVKQASTHCDLFFRYPRATGKRPPEPGGPHCGGLWASN